MAEPELGCRTWQISVIDIWHHNSHTWHNLGWTHFATTHIIIISSRQLFHRHGICTLSIPLRQCCTSTLLHLVGNPHAQHGSVHPSNDDTGSISAQLMMYLRLSPAANIRCSCSLALARAVRIILHSGEEAPVCPLAAFTAPHTLSKQTLHQLQSLNFSLAHDSQPKVKLHLTRSSSICWTLTFNRGLCKPTQSSAHWSP